MIKEKKLPAFFKLMTIILKTPQGFFAFIATLFGLSFLIIIPPFQNPDEDVHFFRAYQVANFQIASESIKDGREFGGSLPASFWETLKINYQGLHGGQLRFNDDEKYRLGALKQSLETPLNSDDQKEFGFTSSSIYSPISYIPHAVGIFIGKVLGSPPVLMMYLGRLSGLLFYLISIYYLIKILPVKKWAFTGLFLLPMILVQASAVTADTVLSVSVAAVIALLLYARENKRLSVAQLIVMGIAVGSAVLSKQVFFLVIPLLLLIPNEVFANRIKKAVYVASTGLLAIACYVAWAAIGNTSKGMQLSVNSGSGANVQGQLEFLLQNPLDIPMIFANTFLTAERGNGIFESLAGNFGWLDTQMPFVGVILVYIIITLIFFTDYTRYVREKKQTFNHTLAFTSFLLFSAIGVSLYVAYTAVSGAAIAGLQGRYYVPVLIILLGMYNYKAIMLDKSQYVKTLKMLSICTLCISVLTIFFRYFIISGI